MIKNDLSPDEQEKRLTAERKYVAQESEKARQHQLAMVEKENQKPHPPADPWPALKSMAYAPCYLFAIMGVVTLALFRAPVPQVLVDFINS